MKVLVTPERYRVIQAVQNCPRWQTAKDIARAAGVSDSTARHTALALAQVGVFKQSSFHTPILYAMSELSVEWETAMEEGRRYGVRELEPAA